jgi:hypothetical protein
MGGAPPQQLTAELVAQLLGDTDADPDVTAVHDAVVVELECDDHGTHRVVACYPCRTVDAGDEDCPPVELVASVLQERMDPCP